MTLARLDSIAGHALDVLLRASWQAAVLAAMVLLVQWLLRERIAARWRYNLWLLVLLRLLVPVTPQSSLSVYNLSNHFRTPAPAPAEVATTPIASPTPPAVSLFADSGSVVNEAPVAPSAKPHATAKPVTPARRPIPWRFVLACAWITGTLILLARIAWATLRLHRAVRRMVSVDAPHVTEMLTSSSRELVIRRRVEILAADDLAAPALMGVFRPRLLLPRHVLEKFDAAELRLILLHELGHLRRRDVLVNWIVSLLQALHWFNPVLWLAFARLRADRELATDELVLSLTGDDRERRAYGDTIVKLLQSLTPTRRRVTAAQPSPLVGAVGILERAHLLRRRITMIAHFRSHHAKRWTVLAAVAMLALAGFGLTDAVRGDDAKTQAAADASASDARPAAATQPSDAVSAIVAQAAQPILSKGGVPTAPDVNAAADAVARKIQEQRLIYTSQGRPANEAAVNAEVDQAQAQLMQVLRNGLSDLDAKMKIKMIESLRLKAKQEAAEPASARSGDDAGGRAQSAGGVVPAATAAAVRKLGESAPEINFEAIPFADAIGFLRDASDLNVFVNWRALEAAGVDRNAPVTVRLKKVPYELALRYILRDVGGGTVALDFAVVDGIVNISTAEEMANNVQVRVYNIARLLNNLPSTMPADPAAMPGAAAGPVENKADRVIQIITETVAPDSWRNAGGPVGSIREINGRLVVAQTEANHAMIAKLLEEIDDTADGDEAAAVSAKK